MLRSPRFSLWLGRLPQGLFSAFAIASAFMTYFCMYAYRKPFTAASYEGARLFSTDVALKSALVASQILGYATSKYLGIKFCSEVTRPRRPYMLLGLIAAAEGALLAFALLPGEWKIVAIFFNGLPLGMVWGLVVWYLEGRRASDVLLSGLCCSFILSSGVVKDVGLWLMGSHGVSEAWMPFCTGLLFLPLFVMSVWLLDHLPEPSAADVAARTEREPMYRSDRLAFVRSFLGGLILLFVAYFFLTAYRDFRDNYGVEIFRDLGFAGKPAIFTRTETPIAFGVMVAMALLNLISNHRLGLLAAHLLMAAGVGLIGAATALFDTGYLGGIAWMTLVGMGSYLAYVPFNSVLFDRLIASTRVIGTAVFAIYLADAIGYTGSIGAMLVNDLGFTAASRLTFFRGLSYFMCGVGLATLLPSAVYFYRRGAHGADAAPRPASALNKL